MKILSSSKELQIEIQSILADNSKNRIIVVAYVGDNAVSYLPVPEGINLYCSTSIPGTNPNSLRVLKKNGVNIYEVKNLHSKIYWSESLGVVVCSANLSNNGLSEDGNHEVGVLLPSNNFDVQKYASSLESVQMSYNRINELEKIYNVYILKNKQKTISNKAKIPNFQEWDDTTCFEWKIYPWTIEGDLPKDVKTKLKTMHPENEYYDFMQTKSNNAYDIGGWVLNIKEIWQGDELIKITDFKWSIPELNIKSLQKNSQNLPFYWIQLSSHMSTYEPFKIKDRKFQKAFEKAYIELINNGQETIQKNNKPTQKFLKSLREYNC
ncbi:MAG: phospholipase D family protein [Gammaproteobacteria bacterium]|nr:phospholipase D family protein [Gammaproteobacteria bacterium]